MKRVNYYGGDRKGLACNERYYEGDPCGRPCNKPRPGLLPYMGLTSRFVQGRGVGLSSLARALAV